jgi:hypothetical protein
MAGACGQSYCPPMTQPLRDLDDVSAFKLSEAGRERLFELTNECIVCWTNKSGWPVGMPARVVIEFTPVEFITYSSAELDDAILSSGFDQWGRRSQDAYSAPISSEVAGDSGAASIPTQPST